jgi:hypothetical protein
VRAYPKRPRISVRRRPQSYALAATSGGKVACEPPREPRVVDHYRITVVVAVSNEGRRRPKTRKGVSPIMRHRHTRVVCGEVASTPGIVVSNDDRAALTPHEALRLRYVWVCLCSRDQVNIATREGELRREDVRRPRSSTRTTRHHVASYQESGCTKIHLFGNTPRLEMIAGRRRCRGRTRSSCSTCERKTHEHQGTCREQVASKG